MFFALSNSSSVKIPLSFKSFNFEISSLIFVLSIEVFSSGLTYYYFLSNVASYAQIFIFKRFVDEEKIKKEIEFNRKRTANTKKSSFQLRIEEAMKARQENNKKNK